MFCGWSKGCSAHFRMLTVRYLDSLLVNPQQRKSCGREAYKKSLLLLWREKKQIINQDRRERSAVSTLQHVPLCILRRPHVHLKVKKPPPFWVCCTNVQEGLERFQASSVRTSQSTSESPMQHTQDQNGARTLRLLTNLRLCLEHLVFRLRSHSDNEGFFMRHNFLCGTCRFKTPKLLLRAQVNRHFLLLVGAFCQGS